MKSGGKSSEEVGRDEKHSEQLRRVEKICAEVRLARIVDQRREKN